MLHQFESPRLLIQHGHESIDDLRSEITAFFASRPYAVVMDRDNQTRQDVHKIRFSAPLPDIIRILVKTITDSFRDALDHSTYSAACCINGGIPKQTGFPFAETANGVLGELSSKRLRGNPIEIRPLLISFKPYKGGNDSLWCLNQIRNPNTHRFLVPVGFSQSGTDIFSMGGILTGPIEMNSVWDASKNELEFMRTSWGSVVNMDMKFAFHITFGDIECLLRKEVLSTLRAIGGEVKHVVSTIELETEKILNSRV